MREPEIHADLKMNLSNTLIGGVSGRKRRGWKQRALLQTRLNHDANETLPQA